MRLDQYLKALEDCPDEFLKEGRERPLWRLTAELGVYDNWPILLGIDFKGFLQHLNDSDFTLVEEIKGKKNTCDACYNPGTVGLRVRNYFEGMVTSKLVSQEHHKRQMSGRFSISVMLHPYQAKKMVGVNEIRVLALVIVDIGRYALEHNIPLCFPNSRGWDNLEDYSRIVYYP